MSNKGIKEYIVKKEKGIYELPYGSIYGMKLPCRLILSEKLLDEIDEEAIKQLARVAMLPGLASAPVGLPDMHWGYGVPIGSVIGFQRKDGIISSGMVGFDINCGISLFKTGLSKERVIEHKERLGKFLLKKIPTGVGSKSNIRLTEIELNRVMEEGARWCVKNNYVSESELKHIEDEGCLEGADTSKVSKEAKKRGIKQLGSLGSGNHFVELSYVKNIFDKKEAEKYGLKKDTICVMIHTGSRGLGHQIATDYVKLHLKAMERYKLSFPDKQLAGAPIGSPEAEDYLKAMKCAANFSFANKLVLASFVEEGLKEFFIAGEEEKRLRGIYTISHNICKKENIQGHEIFVHRKGATRAFPEEPAIIAGSMGSSSFLMKGTEKSLKYSLGSTCHGAGRALSRKEAKQSLNLAKVKQSLDAKGISVFSHSEKGILDEAPKAYKSIYKVIESTEDAGISKKIAEFSPLIVIKG
jgi:tRNA-splicing ligase RtcB